MRQRERLLLGGAAAVLLVIVLYVYVFLPKLQDVRLARSAEAQKKTELTRMTSLAQQRFEIEGQHTLARNALNDLLDRVPAEPALPALLSQVDFALRTSGLLLLEITFPEAAPGAAPGATQPPNAAPAGGVGSLTFQMQVRGHFPQFLSFVQMMEALPRAVIIDSLTVVAAETGTTAALSIRAFYLR